MPVASFTKKLSAHAIKGGFNSAWSYLKHTCSEKYYEAVLGINTRGYLNAKQIGFEGYSSEYNEYEPISFASITAALKEISINSNQDVFLDYGCGKGRAIIVAATHPFKKVIGVELSQSLADIARINIKKARFLQCHDIEICVEDATKYQLPDDVTAILMYAPFVGETLKQVISNINESWSRSPRSITIFHKYPDWTNDPFEHLKDFQLKREIILYSEAGEKLRIYQRRSAT